jgi:hypothetical protein
MLEMEEKVRFEFDRRSGIDRRNIYNFVLVESNQRRNNKERRAGIERRKDWVKGQDWSSYRR